MTRPINRSKTPGPRKCICIAVGPLVEPPQAVEDALIERCKSGEERAREIGLVTVATRALQPEACSISSHNSNAVDETHLISNSGLDLLAVVLDRH